MANRQSYEQINIRHMLVYRHKKTLDRLQKKDEKKKHMKSLQINEILHFWTLFLGTVHIEIYVMLFKQNGINTRRTSEILTGYMATLKFELK